MWRILTALIFAIALAGPALAVNPDEMLKNPALEARAEAIGSQLRCLVCRNESIEESNASLAHDLRVLLRQRLVAGDTDQQAINFIVARYGEFVLLNPPKKGVNWILWLSGPAVLLLGGALAWVTLRRRAQAPESADLSAEEQARLKNLLADKG